MDTLRAEERSSSLIRHHLNTGMLRRWSSPQIILVATDLADEQSIRFHAIQQARQSGAKVLVVEVSGGAGETPRTHNWHGQSSSGSVRNPRNTAQRIVSHLRSSGIDSEPVVVHSVRVEEIPSIARSCSADRVLVSAPTESQGAGVHQSIADILLGELEIPICVVRRDLSALNRYQRPSRRITLALSLYAQNEIPIAFCSRFAQECHSQLTIMHIFPKGIGNRRRTEEMQKSFVSRLPPAILKEAEMLCPVEISVREGETTAEILSYESWFNQDFLVIAPARDGDLIGLGVGAAQRIIREARCPVIVLPEQANADEEPQRAA